MRYSCGRSVFITLGLLLIALPASAISIDWIWIGDPGHAADTEVMTCCNNQANPSIGTSGYGSVAYAYHIAKFEITNAQYAEFLNAKAKADPLGLYATNMTEFGGIERGGDDGSYTYSAITGREGMPVTYVSFFDTLRFANWMNNGQGDADTESGAYTLLGGTPTPSNGNTVTRNPGASIVLTSEDEWYKAAYFDPISATYFDYPTGSDSPTSCVEVPTAAPNSANCEADGNLANASAVAVGSYPGSPSPYGTFDQGGNVFEWNEAARNNDSTAGIRGGGYVYPSSYLAASTRGTTIYTSDEGDNRGFRIAMLPEPSTGLLVIGGLLGLSGWRRVRA